MCHFHVNGPCTHGCRARSRRSKRSPPESIHPRSSPFTIHHPPTPPCSCHCAYISPYDRPPPRQALFNVEAHAGVSGAQHLGQRRGSTGADRLPSLPPRRLSSTHLPSSSPPPASSLSASGFFGSSKATGTGRGSSGFAGPIGYSVGRPPVSRSTVRPCLRPTSLLMRRKGKGHTQRAPSSLLSDALPSALHGNSLLLLCFPISSE